MGTQTSIPNLMIDIDGSGPVPLAAFLQDNEFDADETSEIIDALTNAGRYFGGGGASGEFALSVLGPPESWTPETARRRVGGTYGS